MPKSEYILSDERLRREAEDAFFRRVMAKYCEDESKKLLSELEAEPKKPNLSVIDGMISKIRKKKNRRAAFSVLKRITNGVAMLVLAAVIVFAGAVTASADVRSSLAEFTSRWEKFESISENKFDLNGEDVKSFTVNYATGWNFDSEGSIKIKHESKIFGGTVYLPSSRYFVNYTYGIDNYPAAVCNDNTYTVSYDDSAMPIKGIITSDENGDAVFYPYYNKNGNNLFMVCKRNEDSENEFKENLYLALPDGEKVKVQPFCVNLHYFDDNSGYAKEPVVSDFSSSGSDYLEVEIKLQDLTVWPFCDGEGEEIWGTRASAFFESLESVTVTKEY